MNGSGYVPLQHRGLPDTPRDGEHVESESIRQDRLRTREGTGITGHHTRESFMRATGGRQYGDPEPAPIQPGYSAAEARAGLLAAWREKYDPVAVASRASDDAALALRDEGRSRAARNRVYYPELATDAEIRQATRTGREQ